MDGIDKKAHALIKSHLTKRAPDGAIAPKFYAQFAKFGAIMFGNLAKSAPPVTQTVSPLHLGKKSRERWEKRLIKYLQVLSP